MMARDDVTKLRTLFEEMVAKIWDHQEAF